MSEEFISGPWLEALEAEKSLIPADALLAEAGEIDTGFLSPRWPSPLPELDQATHGGVYGVTALGGNAGSGKSMFAASVALKVALLGVRAIYVAAEMTREQNLSRFGWLGAQWGYGVERVASLLGKELVVLPVEPRSDFEEFGWSVGRWLMGQKEALLVIDSVNSLLGHLADGGGYWQLYDRVLGAVVYARRKTEGKLGALVISELNKAGASKGEKLEYASDLMLNFKKTATPRVVKIAVMKNRERGSDGPLGEFRMTSAGTYERLSG